MFTANYFEGNKVMTLLNKYYDFTSTDLSKCWCFHFKYYYSK